MSSQKLETHQGSKSPAPSPDPDIDDGSSKRQATRYVFYFYGIKFKLINVKFVPYFIT